MGQGFRVQPNRLKPLDAGWTRGGPDYHETKNKTMACLSRGGPVHPEAGLSRAIPEAGLSLESLASQSFLEPFLDIGAISQAGLTPTGVPRPSKNARPPGTTLGPWAQGYCRDLGGGAFL